MLLNELILPGHCASCYAVSADSLPTTIITSHCVDLAFHLNEFTLSVCAHVSFAADTSAAGEGLLPHCLHLCWMYCIHVPQWVLFAMLPACYLSCCYIFPCIRAAGCVPRSRFTPLSQTVFLLYLSPFANDMSAPSRIIMVVLSDQWLER